jgi:hypothetical protein
MRKMKILQLEMEGLTHYLVLRNLVQRQLLWRTEDGKLICEQWKMRVLPIKR